MKVVFFVSGGVASPTLRDMISKDMVAGICMPAKEFLGKHHIIDVANMSNIPYIETTSLELATKVKSWIQKIDPDYVFVLTFSYKIPGSLLSAVKGRFYNIHFGTLPEYRGPEPIFWQMKNNETEIGITVHKMDEDFDTGPIVMIDRIPISPMDTYGTLQNTIGQAAVMTTGKLVNALANNAIMELPQKAGEGNYYKKPGFSEVLINWAEDDSATIQALVRACNPWNKGAITYIRGMVIKVLAVSELEIDGEITMEPGTMVNLNEFMGTYVVTCDKKVLSLDIIYLEEGFITGTQFRSFGFQPGEKFSSEVQMAI